MKRRSWRSIAAAATIGLLAGCSSEPESPVSPTPAVSVVPAVSVTVRPRNPVRLLPDILEAKIQSFRPYVWNAGWTVTVKRADAATTPIEVQSVRARIEAGGRVLAETTSLTGSRALTEDGVTIDQSLTYEAAIAPPSQSRLLVTVHVFSGNGVAHEVSTAGNTIEERYCGGRAQGGCSGTFVAVRTDGTLLIEGNLWVGQTAYFFDGDRVAHSFRCDPHPAHTGCDELNPVNLGALGSGNEYGYSDVFRKAGTYEFHDEAQPANAALRGRLVVQCCIF